MILGFDPGRDKCGIAVMDRCRHLHYHAVIPSAEALTTLESLWEKFDVEVLVIGDQTTSRSWQKQLREILPTSIPIIVVDERYSSLEARERYWELYPPQGLWRLIPQGMRTPGRPVDDIVAMILIERYLRN